MSDVAPTRRVNFEMENSWKDGKREREKEKEGKRVGKRERESKKFGIGCVTRYDSQHRRDRLKTLSPHRPRYRFISHLLFTSGDNSGARGSIRSSVTEVRLRKGEETAQSKRKMGSKGSNRKANHSSYQNAGSFLTDENEEPLARPVPRNDLLVKLSSAWSMSDDPMEGADESAFHNRLLKGAHSRLPERSSHVLHKRRFGTMTERADSEELSRKAGCVRLRVEHMEQTDKREHGNDENGDKGSEEEGESVRKWELYEVRSAHSVLSIGRNAMVRELDDLQTMIRSMETRKYDVCAADVHALFAWFQTVENFARLYLSATERCLYARGGAGRWGNGKDIWDRAKRQEKKVAVIASAEHFEKLRRPMLALDEQCRDMLPELRKRSSMFARAAMRVVDAEARQVQRELDRRCSDEELHDMCKCVMRDIRQRDCGKGVLLVMSLGLGVSRSERVAWVRGMCQGMSGLVVQIWMGRFSDRHWKFMELFDRAEREYRRMYCELGRELDDRVAAIRTESAPRLARS